MEALREKLLAGLRRPRVIEETSFAGERVMIRRLTVREQLAFELEAAQLPGDGVSRGRAERLALLVTWCVCKADGQRVMTSEDVPAIVDSDIDVLTTAADCLRLNRLTKEEVSEIKKKSPTEPSGDSPTG